MLPWQLILEVHELQMDQMNLNLNEIFYLFDGEGWENCRPKEFAYDPKSRMILSRWRTSDENWQPYLGSAYNSLSEA